VAEIVYGNWTTDGVMRHPKFLSLREGKAARDVRQRECGGSADHDPDLDIYRAPKLLIDQHGTVALLNAARPG
jgi:hypothetical protein